MASLGDDGTLGRWINALESTGWSGEAEDEWKKAVDVFYDRTQQLVHIDTGELISSGTTRSFRKGESLIGEVEYTADYAIYEARRGDSHDFLNRAYEQVRDVFPRAMIKVMETEFGPGG